MSSNKKNTAVSRADLLNALLNVTYSVPESNYLAPFYNLKQLIWENLTERDVKNFESGKEYAQAMLKRLEKEMLRSKELVSDFSRRDETVPEEAAALFRKIIIEKNFISTIVNIPAEGNVSAVYKGNRGGFVHSYGIKAEGYAVFETANRFTPFYDEDFSAALITDSHKIALSYEDSGAGMKNTYSYFVYYIDGKICVRDRLSKYISLPEDLIDISSDKSYKMTVEQNTGNEQ